MFTNIIVEKGSVLLRICNVFWILNIYICVYNFTSNQCIIIIIVIPAIMKSYLLRKGFCKGKCDKINVFTSQVFLCLDVASPDR